MTIHVLLTGASRGIGAATADRLRREDVRLCTHASRPHAGIDLAFDLADAGAAAALWQAALDQLDGRIDVLINNAGIFEAAPLDLPDSEWETGWARTMEVNLTASTLLARQHVRQLLDAGRAGRLISVASRAAYRGDSPDHWHYAASKAGMVAVTKTIARGYADRGILALAVCPGFVRTDMAADYLAEGPPADIPLGRVAEADEVAELIAFASLRAPPSMTGAVLDINGASHVR